MLVFCHQVLVDMSCGQGGRDSRLLVVSKADIGQRPPRYNLPKPRPGLHPAVHQPRNMTNYAHRHRAQPKPGDSGTEAYTYFLLKEE